MTNESTNPRIITSVERAFSVLQSLAAAHESMGVSALGRATGLAKSTTARLLATLEHLGMVERIGDDGRYQLGAGLSVLAPRATATLPDLARSHLRELVERTGEDAALTVADGFDVIYVEQAQGPGAVQVQDWTGARIPAHTVAAGYVLMRAWEPAALDAYLSEPLERLTDLTVLDPAVVRQRVEEWEGYVRIDGEFAEDVSGVAAPIHDPGGEIVAALNVYGPSYRFSEDGDIGPLLVDAAAKVTEHLTTISTASGS